MKKDICIVGIAGGSASGKTTIVNNIKELFQNDIELISHDNYYLSNDDKTMEERVKLNYDHPSHLLLNKHLHDLHLDILIFFHHEFLP